MEAERKNPEESKVLKATKKIIVMCTKIKSKLLCLEGYGQNSNVWKIKTKMSMFGRIRSEFECLEGEGKNSNV